MKFFIKDSFSKCDQIHSKLWNSSEIAVPYISKIH